MPSSRPPPAICMSPNSGSGRTRPALDAGDRGGLGRGRSEKVSQPRLEVAEVFRQYGERFLNRCGHTVSASQRKALSDLGACRTAALGGRLEQCDSCAHRVIAFNSCRNRHCPKCQSRARDRWLAKQAQEPLPVPYCHVVFTVPQALAPLGLQNQRRF